ncbi:MAG: class I SAM-dependent methyltransferase [Roseiflexaceae bacterium]
MSIVDDRGYNQGFKPSASLAIRNARRVAHLLRCVHPLVAPHHMLEIGCGTGEYAAILAQHPAVTILGTDICQPFIDYARQHYGGVNINFACFDFTDSTEVTAHVGSTQFDSVVGNGILHHMYYHIDSVLGHIWQLLRPGGRLAFMEPNLYNPYIAAIFCIPTLRRWARLEPSEMAFRRQVIVDALMRAGFVDITVEYRDFLVPGTPALLVTPVVALGAVCERIPLINMLAQSLLISARRPLEADR